MAVSPTVSGLTLDVELEKKIALEKQFHVKYIPQDYDDWKVFHIFRKYGLIDFVRIPNTLQQGRGKYGFVAMLTYEGADAVKNALVEGGLLKVDENVALKVSSVNASSRTNDSNKENNFRGTNNFNRRDDRNRTPFSAQSRSNQVNNVSKNSPFAKPAEIVSVKYGTIPCGNHVKVKSVHAPSNAPIDRLIFYVVVDKEEDPEHAAMEQSMEEVVSHCRPLAIANVKDSDYVIVRNAGKLRRAVITGRRKAVGSGDNNEDLTAYLVDVAAEVPIKEGDVYPITATVAAVPTKVRECEFAGLVCLKPGKELFESVRNLLDKVTHAAELFVKLITTRGSTNVVAAYSVFTPKAGGPVERGNIVEGLAAKNGNFKFSADDAEPREYSRDQVMFFRQEAMKLPIPTCVAKDFTELLSPMDFVINGMTQMSTA